MGKKLDQTLAVLNGLLGDYLARTQNGLATDMACYRDGRRLALDASAIAAAYPTAGARVVVLVHGVMCTESIWQLPDGSDYGSRLATDLGFTPLYVRYNSGRSIAESGAELAQLLEQLVAAYPIAIEELLLVGYSMGGLLLRRACHVAGLEGHAWLAHVKRAFYIGTPHLGAPAERVGRAVAQILQLIDDPYTRLVADIGNLRSAGIKDLGDADLRPEDRARARTARSLNGTAPALRGGASLSDPRHPLPLLPGIDHYLIAGSLTIDPRLAMLFGDSLVPVGSATYAESAEPPRSVGALPLMNVANELLPRKRVKVLPGLSHLALAHHADVYTQIKAWCEEQT